MSTARGAASVTLPPMRTVSVHWPSCRTTAARCRYVLDWVAAHPYAERRLRLVDCADAADRHLDLAGLTRRSAWLGAVPGDRGASQLGRGLSASAITPEGTTVYSLGEVREATFYTEDRYAFDWVATLFFWLTCWEERALPHARSAPPPAEDSWFGRRGLERDPQADRLCAAVLESLGLRVRLRPTRAHLSHDLDHTRLYLRPWTGVRYGAFVARRGGGPRALAQALTQQRSVRRGRTPDPYDNPGQTLGPAGGTLFLLLGSHVRQDGASGKVTADFRTWVDVALTRGYRLGLHPSYTTPEYPRRMTKELESFRSLTGEQPRVSRQHFLRWRWGATAAALSDLGIQGDSTLGYRDRLGFRCGTSFPYRLYDFRVEAAGALTEWPLAGMDGGWAAYNGYDPERCHADWQDFTTRNRLGADLMLLIHNSYYEHARLAGIDLAAWTRWVSSRERAPWPAEVWS